jgi:ABC transport system ATP-binding/permease protein
MNLVNLEAVVVAYGTRVLLDHVSLGVAAGDRVGVVGRNGVGKSTLLAALAGTGEFASGRSTRARDVQIGYLPQSARLTGVVRTILFENIPEHEWAGDPAVRALLSGLLAGIDLAAPAERLSGGQARRVALAQVLLGRHDLLLLDEPTNHLDIEGIRWLAEYLTTYGARTGTAGGSGGSSSRASTTGGSGPSGSGAMGVRGLPGGQSPRASGVLPRASTAFVVVTHDRWFLDAVSERTWELADGQVRAYDGGYAAYVLARAERARQAVAADQRRRALLRKELAWLQRGAPARTSKPRFRLDAATVLIADEPPPRDTVELSKLAATRLGKTVIDLTDVTVDVGGLTLLDQVTWQLGPGDRVGVIGVNGSGKSTLLNVLAGRADGPVPVFPGEAVFPGETVLSGDAVISGEVVTGKTVRLGYLTQEPPPVNPGQRAIEAAALVRGSVRVGKRELSASQLLDRLGLRGERQSVPVSDLSGGERRRLQLQMVLMAEPNVLLLDEPTNDLDIDSLTELEDLLDGFAGSVVVVSHDQYFLERVTDHVLALAGGKLAFLPGGVDEYLARRQRPAPDAGRRAGTAPGPQTGTAPGAAAGAQTGAAAGSRAGASAGARAGATAGPSVASAVPTAARLRDAKKELAKLDRQLARLGGREAELHEALAAAAADYARLIELGDDLRELQTEKAALEDRWLELAEETSGPQP